MKYNIETTIQEIKEKGQKVLFFWGHQPSKNGDISKSCLSQWWLSCFEEDDKTYHTAEHYMMAQKAKLFGDIEIMNAIISSKDPKDVKALGRKVKNFDSQKWDSKKLEIVTRGNILKFSQNKHLGDYLLSTDTCIIVEASPVDKIWGIGLVEDHADALEPTKWRGQNLLGFALMEVRDHLQKIV